MHGSPPHHLLRKVREVRGLAEDQAGEDVMLQPDIGRGYFDGYAAMKISKPCREERAYMRSDIYARYQPFVEAGAKR